MFLDLFAVVFARVVWVGTDCGELDERRNDPSYVAPVGSTVICSGTKGGAMSRVERSGAGIGARSTSGRSLRRRLRRAPTL